MLSLIDLAAVLVTLAAISAWINARYVGLPQNVALLVMGLTVSLTLALVTFFWPESDWTNAVRSTVRDINFSDALLDGLLGFMLFAGALQIDVGLLRRRLAGVLSLATIGVALTAVTVAVGLWLVTGWMGHPIPLTWAFVFGALIAPTDPVAVLSTLKAVSPPKSIELDISGETLFNDGMGVVLFAVALSFASSSENPSLASIAELLLLEAAGGAVLGAVTGYVVYRALRLIDDYSIEVMLSLALVMGTYALADSLGMSGPIAVVVAGVLIGKRGRDCAMTETTQRYVFGFWILVDDILNAVLFLLIGLEVLLLQFSPLLAAIGAVTIPIVLFARFVAVSGAVLLLGRIMRFVDGAIPVLTWGGVRGGVSIALALSIPDIEYRGVLLAVTYNVVLFSVLVQATTLGRLIRRTVSSPKERTQSGADG